MSKYLVIVESPAKAQTIEKFLGKNYEVMASNGHVRDLPKSQLGVDVQHDFEPKYITIRGKGDLLAKLRKEAKKASKVYLATDPDREGEAISWHLLQSLNIDPKKAKRITFNEITKNTVKQSIKQAREINMDLVDSQQARRMMDRMVGYMISPLLWAKVKRGLSAGRVQSVALRMICDREGTINEFVPEEYWNLEATFNIEGLGAPLEAKFYGRDGKKTAITSREQLDEVLKDLDGAKFQISDVKKSERVKKSPLPFITSTLQQEAAKTLNFSTQKTMRLAQQLYEGIEVKGKGTIGLITYLRTDSTRVSDEADAACKAFVEETYGDEYVAKGDANGRAKKSNVQDAHEAIRPTYVELTPVQVKEDLSRDLFRLYQLVWKRFVASRMQPAKYETTSIKIEGGGCTFTSAASKLLFAGYLSTYQTEEDKQEGESLRSLSKGLAALEKSYRTTTVTVGEYAPSQHFTQAPPHYTEASLVKALEEQGIGRPSTYAPTITTILARRYIAKEQKNLYPTELGEIVNQIMKQSFASIVDVTFTANLETLLDGVEDGSIAWKTVVSNFYPDLEEAVKQAEKELQEVKIEDEVTDVVCEHCGANMVVKYGPHGKFLACPSFPECRNTKPFFEKTGIPCPVCDGEIVIKKTKKGRRYFGCSNHPECEFMAWQKPSDKKCPQCGGVLLEKGKKLVCNSQDCAYYE